MPDYDKPQVLSAHQQAELKALRELNGDRELAPGQGETWVAEVIGPASCTPHSLPQPPHVPEDHKPRMLTAKQQAELKALRELNGDRELAPGQGETWVAEVTGRYR